MNKLVSIIMPVFNNSKTIRESIDSVLSQTYKKFELIIIDDGSDDSSIEIVESYKDDRILLISNNLKKGASGARQSGIDISSGDYIAFLDSDDVWNESKLDSHIKYMTKYNEVFTYNDYYIFDSEGNNYLYKAPSEINYNKLTYYCPIGCLTVVLDKSILTTNNIRFIDSPKEDYVYWLSILKCGYTAKNISSANAWYRLQTQSLSSNKFKELHRQFHVLYRTQNINLGSTILKLIIYSIQGIFKHYIKR